MKKVILIMVLSVIGMFAQTNITIPMLNVKSSLDSSDLFLISQSDTNYYKYLFDGLIDQVEDSLSKSQIAYKNSANTFTSSQTFSGGFTSTNTSTFSSTVNLNGTNTVNGAITFNSRPTFNGAVFDAATYGMVRFNDSTYFNNGHTTFFGNNVDFIGSNLVISGSQSFTANSVFKLPQTIYPTLNLSALGYVGSDGDAKVIFDYGTTTGQRDSLASQRYVRNNYAGLSSNNTLSGSNNFTGQTTFNGRVNFNEPIVYQIDSLEFNIGEFQIVNMNQKSPFIVIYGANDAPMITDIDELDGQEVTFLIHPSTYTTVTFVNNASIKCAGGVNAVLGPGDVITFINYRGIWYEKSRSDN